MGVAFLLGLARQRSLASAALLFLLLVDEMEGIAFVGVRVLLGRVDLFLAMQDAVFPAVVLVAGAVSLAHGWRRRPPAVALPDPEPLDLAALAQRIGAAR